MSKLMNVDAENGKETYEELLKRCESFEPNVIWVMKLVVSVNFNRWYGEEVVRILGYSKDRDTATGWAEYHATSMADYIKRNSAKCPSNVWLLEMQYIFNRGMIDTDEQLHFLSYQECHVNFEIELVHERGIPSHREKVETYLCDPEKNTKCKKTSCQTLCFETTDPRYRKEDK